MSLPGFLLAFANNRLVWLGLRHRALPAITERWSLARWLALVGIKVVFGVLLGWLISLLAFRQPLPWLMWLFGLFAGCQSFVMSGLTALCWNQRVARLRAKSDEPVALPPTRYRVLRWLVGIVYYVMLAVVTPAVMVLTAVNLYGQWAWHREYARLVARGEKLTSAALLGPAIPASENAAAAPVFAPFFDYTPGSNELRPEATNAIVRLQQALFLPPVFLPERPSGLARFLKHPEDVEAWALAYRKLIELPKPNHPPWVASLTLPPPGNPAQDVLTGLAASDAVMADFCAVAARPRSQFPIRFDMGFDVGGLAHLSLLKGIQQNLRVRCIAHLAAGVTNAAFADATNALNVAELLRDEPLLISQLVRMAQSAIATDTLWNGLITHRWTDAQLAFFQFQLSRVDFWSGLIRALEGERLLGITGTDELIAGRGFGSESATGLRRTALLLPLGVLRLNEVALTEMYTEWLTALRSLDSAVPPNGFAARLMTNGDTDKHYPGRPKAEALRSAPASPFNVLAKMLFPALYRAESGVARFQTMNYLAITVCGLERYRLAHGRYPETLDALVPAFLPKPLPDPMSGQPFHYRPTDDGWFLLYSVGENGRDDGGTFRRLEDGPILDWPWPVPGRNDGGLLF